MKRNFIIFLLLTVLLISAACTQSGETPEDPNTDITIAARVNGVDISMAEFNEAYEQNLSYYDNAGLTLDEASISQLKDQVLDKLIQNELLKQFAAQDSYEVFEEEVEEAYQWYVSQYESEENLLSLLEEEGITVEEFRDNLRLQIDIDSYVNGYLINNDLLNELTVTDAEIQAAFEQISAESGSSDLTLEDIYDYLKYSLEQEKIQAVLDLVTDALVQESEIEYFLNK